MPKNQRPSSQKSYSETPPSSDKKNPRILIVTPEITYLPEGMGNLSQRMTAKAGGMADVSASLVSVLYQNKADVHVALPNYRRMFQEDENNHFEDSLSQYQNSLPETRIHLAQDRVFYHRSQVYSPAENHLLSLAFQREVINHIIPKIQPDIIHCNDWMTGLIPAYAKHLGIKTLFTAHNIHTEQILLSDIEDRGIDAASFWKHCYYTRAPHNYEESRETNPVDFLTTGIFSSDYVNTVSPTFLSEVIDGQHPFIPNHICHELWSKASNGYASGILNAPDQNFDPRIDPYLEHSFDANSFIEGKAKNKALLQKTLGLHQDPNAPILFWSSRLDPLQKGPQLLTHLLYQLTHEHPNLQVVLIANGSFQQHFHDIVLEHNLYSRVAVQNFSEKLSHLGYAGADFMIMPSRFEPCGLPQMVSPKYGTLPIAHNTGGISDTVEHINPRDLNEQGTGFLFDHFSSAGLHWAIQEALHFYALPNEVKHPKIAHIMGQTSERFSHTNTAKSYIDLYETILERPIGR